VNTIIKNGLLVLIILLGVIPVYSGGFQVNEHGARATGMAGAVYATLNDASAVHFNPGALSFMDGTHIMFGTTLIFPKGKFRGPFPSVDQTDMESPMSYPSVFYASHTLSNGLAFGFGMFNPYGSGTKWPDNWVGRNLAMESSLRTFFFNPTVSYRVTDYMGIAVGFNYVYSDIDLQQGVSFEPTFAGNGDVRLTGSGSGIGWNIGLYTNITPEFSAGLAFRSGVGLDLEGDAEYTDIPRQIGEAGLLPGDKIEASVTLPANLFAGIAYTGIDKLTIGLGFQYVFWSSVEEIALTFTDTGNEDALVFNYVNSYIARIGFEYQVNSDLAVRAGYLFDKNPTPDEYMRPGIPDADRHGFTLGVGYQINDKIGVDFGYLFIRFNERRIENSNVEYKTGARMNGVYNVSGHLPSINFKFNL